MEEVMEIDEEDEEDLPTLPISQTWDCRELDDILGDGLMVKELMAEDQEVRFDDLDVYLVMVDQLMEVDLDERFHFH